MKQQVQHDGTESADWSTEQINRMIKLALASPDEELVRRYFALRTQSNGSAGLTKAEQRWVAVNLESNPSWQALWAQLEAESGRSVALSRSPETQPVHTRVPVLRRFGWVAAAAVVLLALYVGLWGVSHITVAPTHDLASIAAHEAIVSSEVRGDADERSDFERGLQALQTAERTRLGLFPYYDETQVETALTHLDDAFNNTTDPFQRAESAFFLAKAHLMKADIANARHWLEQVLDQQVADYRDEATQLLSRLNDI